MIIQETISKLITILYSILVIIGAFLITYTASNWGKKTDNNVLRARAFLSVPFLKDNWVLLLLIFIFNAITPMIDIMDPFMGRSNVELIKSLTHFGIIAGIVMLEYKWFNLLNPSKYQRPGHRSGNQ